MKGHSKYIGHIHRQLFFKVGISFLFFFEIHGYGRIQALFLFLLILDGSDMWYTGVSLYFQIEQ